VAAIVAERVTALLEARLRSRDKLAAERSHRFEPLARSLAENEEESAIITMLLDDYYQQSLHALPVQPSGAPASQGHQDNNRKPNQHRNRPRR
jgi:ATP-dependent RNA helicase DeaD